MASSLPSLSPQGIDLNHRHERKANTNRKAPKTENVYVLLLVKVCMGLGRVWCMFVACLNARDPSRALSIVCR